MDRFQVLLLSLCALLTTTLDPFLDREARVGAEIASASAGGIAPDLPAVSSAPPTGEARSTSDDEIIAQILRRLAIRHTALPERERIALAHTILQEARLQGLEPDLVVAVIEVESAGYHLAVSHVGAMGLMQLLPATAKELADEMEITWHGPDTLFDPATNVKLGTAYLRKLADRYDGNVSIALAAYNWGPGRIDRRLRRGATVPSRYIEQVMRAYDRNTPAVPTRS